MVQIIQKRGTGVETPTPRGFQCAQSSYVLYPQNTSYIYNSYINENNCNIYRLIYRILMFCLRKIRTVYTTLSYIHMPLNFDLELHSNKRTHKRTQAHIKRTLTRTNTHAQHHAHMCFHTERGCGARGHARARAHTHTHTHKHTHTRRNAHTHTHTHTRTHTQTYTHTQTHIYLHTRIHVCT